MRHMRKGVSALVQVNPVLGLASGNPGRGAEVILESRWSIPVGIAFGADGQAVTAQCVLVGVEKKGTVYRYRLKLVETDSDLRKPCEGNDLEPSVAGDGSEHPDSAGDPNRAG